MRQGGGVDLPKVVAENANEMKNKHASTKKGSRNVAIICRNAAWPGYTAHSDFKSYQMAAPPHKRHDFLIFS